MRINKIMTIQFLITILSASSPHATDALVDDFSSGTKENCFENYWYYYDDNTGTKPDDRPQAGMSTKQSTIDVPYYIVNREAAGNKADTFKIRRYSFLVKEEAGNKYTCMPFTFGNKWEAAWCGPGKACADPFVGIGTMLAPDNEALDLTGATAIRFKCRAHVNDLAVYFKVETMDISRDSSYAFWNKAIYVPKGIWTEFTVALPGDLMQPGWAREPQIKRFFDSTECTNLSWDVNHEANTTVTQDTLDIDDVWIINYTHQSASLWYKTATNRPERGLVSSFESPTKSTTPLGTTWFAYDDHEDSGNSSITTGAAVDRTKGLFPLDWSGTNTGFNNTGFGAAVRMQFGRTLSKVGHTGDTTAIQGFTGMGFSLCDSAKALYFNSSTGKLGNIGGTGRTDSIYFEYLADGDFRYLTLEVRDSNDVGDKNAPARKDKRGKGAAWYRNFPKTGPTWRSVCIPFDSLITHDAWKDYKHIPLDKTSLATIQFRIQGPEGGEGVIQIDNVYFPGIEFPRPNEVKNNIDGSGRQSFFRAYYRNGFVRVEGESMRDCESGSIRIFDSKGALITSAGIGSAPGFSRDISTKQLPAGVYFMLVTGILADSKMISRQMPVTILK